jgi:hypothetical protein
MSASPSPALALTRAFGRLELSGARVVNAAQTGDDLPAALVAQVEAKTGVRAALALVRFSDDMAKALLEIVRPPR